MFFRQGYGAGVLPPTPRACAPPTVAEDKKFHAGHGRRVPKKEKASLGDCTQGFQEKHDNDEVKNISGHVRVQRPEPRLFRSLSLALSLSLSECTH